MFFDEKLKEIPMKGMTVEKAVSFFNKVMVKKVTVQDIKEILGIHYCKMEPNDNTKSFDIVPNTDFIYIQLMSDMRVSFGYVVAIIMHEMIHFYDSLFGNLLQLHYQFLFNDIPYDMHGTTIFRKYMKMANDNDIMVKEDGEGKSFNELNKEAQKYFLNLHDGDEELKIESYEGKKFGTYPITIKRKDGTYDFFVF